MKECSNDWCARPTYAGTDLCAECHCRREDPQKPCLVKDCPRQRDRAHRLCWEHQKEFERNGLEPLGGWE